MAELLIMETFTLPFDVASLVASIWPATTLPDYRLYARLHRSARMLVDRLDGPISRLPRRLTQGAQRFWNNPRVNPDALMEPMLAFQAQQIAQCPALFVAHDTMEIDLTGAHEPDDAGPLRSSSARGHLMHWALAIEPGTGHPRAALACQIWTRPKTPRHADHATRPPEQRESIKWKKGIEQVLTRLHNEGITAQLTHLFDREGDTHDNLRYATTEQQRVICRVMQDRVIQQSPGLLYAFMDSASDLIGEATLTREVPNKLRDSELKAARAQGRAAVDALRAQLAALKAHRKASLRVRWAHVTLTPDPKVKKSLRRSAQTVWCVWIEEQNAPSVVEPLVWRLWSTVAVTNAAEAEWVLDGYRSRWPIEPMHKVLKTGLQVEQTVVSSVSGTQRLMSVLLPLSLHLVRWTQGLTQSPQTAAASVVATPVIEALKSACRFHQQPMPRRAWTIKDFVLRLAALGGYEHRPDRTPGWLVLWRGWQQLQTFWRTVDFARTADPRALPTSGPPKTPWKPRYL